MRGYRNEHSSHTSFTPATSNAAAPNCWSHQELTGAASQEIMILDVMKTIKYTTYT